VPMVKRERNESAGCHRHCVVAGRLFLHAGHGAGKHQRRGCSCSERHTQHADGIDRLDLTGYSLFSNRGLLL
jgi:hypothetical protein